ncbi:mucin-5AC-like isoform X3 [Rana temporaria]|uniref:mucin-5AC-like isoform X3 n=1 Tax=Rana temporaria TaxID=8407 RepID=UPI001AACAD35|nr:mucin-5AC-like isoform X3 [Rana temporaria]
MQLTLILTFGLFCVTRSQFVGRCTTNPLICCKGVDSACRRVDCYCDQYCTSNGDCCPDYNLACDAVAATTASSKVATSISGTSSTLSTTYTSLNSSPVSTASTGTTKLGAVSTVYVTKTPDISTSNTPIFTQSTTNNNLSKISNQTSFTTGNTVSGLTGISTSTTSKSALTVTTNTTSNTSSGMSAPIAWISTTVSTVNIIPTLVSKAPNISSPMYNVTDTQQPTKVTATSSYTSVAAYSGASNLTNSLTTIKTAGASVSTATPVSPTGASTIGSSSPSVPYSSLYNNLSSLTSGVNATSTFKTTVMPSVSTTLSVALASTNIASSPTTMVTISLRTTMDNVNPINTSLSAVSTTRTAGPALGSTVSPAGIASSTTNNPVTLTSNTTATSRLSESTATNSSTLPSQVPTVGTATSTFAVTSGITTSPTINATTGKQLSNVTIPINTTAVANLVNLTSNIMPTSSVGMSTQSTSMSALGSNAIPMLNATTTLRTTEPQVSTIASSAFLNALSSTTLPQTATTSLSTTTVPVLGINTTRSLTTLVLNANTTIQTASTSITPGLANTSSSAISLVNIPITPSVSDPPLTSTKASTVTTQSAMSSSVTNALTSITNGSTTLRTTGPLVSTITSNAILNALNSTSLPQTATTSLPTTTVPVLGINTTRSLTTLVLNANATIQTATTSFTPGLANTSSSISLVNISITPRVSDLLLTSTKASTVTTQSAMSSSVTNLLTTITNGSVPSSLAFGITSVTSKTPMTPTNTTSQATGVSIPSTEATASNNGVQNNTQTVVPSVTITTRPALNSFSQGVTPSTSSTAAFTIQRIAADAMLPLNKSTDLQLSSTTANIPSIMTSKPAQTSFNTTNSVLQNSTLTQASLMNSGATGSSQISSTTGPVTSALWSSSSEKASSPDKTFFSTKPSGSPVSYFSEGPVPSTNSNRPFNISLPTEETAGPILEVKTSPRKLTGKRKKLNSILWHMLFSDLMSSKDLSQNASNVNGTNEPIGQLELHNQTRDKGFKHSVEILHLSYLKIKGGDDELDSGKFIHDIRQLLEEDVEDQGFEPPEKANP